MNHWCLYRCSDTGPYQRGMDTALGAHFLIINKIDSRLSTHVSLTEFDRILKCRHFTQFQFAFLHAVPFLQCVKVLTQFYLRLPQSHSNLCAYGALSLASHFVVSCRPRDVVPRVFRLSQMLCVVSVRRAIPNLGLGTAHTARRVSSGASPKALKPVVVNSRGLHRITVQSAYCSTSLLFFV